MGPQAAAGLNEYPRAVNSLISTPEMDDASGELRALPFLTDAGAIAKRFPQQNRESFSELVHGFFELWGREGSGKTVFVYDGERETNDLGVLVMRCPLTGKNVNPFTPTVWRAIHAEFERAATLLSQGCSLLELCEVADASPAGRAPR